MKKLQILVPQYKETDEKLQNLLDSIELQQGVNFDDFEVLIMNDGTDIYLSQDFLNYYTYNIQYYKNKHLGISGTRNSLMKKATAEYIMFCDSDDMFISSLALYTIFQEMQQHPFDLLIAPFMEETKAYTLDNKGNRVIIDKFIYIEKGVKDKDGVDSTFIHGKVYNRNFLEKNNIQWRTELKCNEDSHFNSLCINLAQKVLYVPKPYYLYKWNEGSVTKPENVQNYRITTYQYFFWSEDFIIQDLIDRGLSDRARKYIAILIYDGYYFFHYIENTDQERYDYLKSIYAGLYKKYVDTFNSIPIDELNKTIDQIKLKYTYRQAPKTIDLDFSTWIEKEILPCIQ